MEKFDPNVNYEHKYLKYKAKYQKAKEELEGGLRLTGSDRHMVIFAKDGEKTDNSYKKEDFERLSLSGDRTSGVRKIMLLKLELVKDKYNIYQVIGSEKTKGIVNITGFQKNNTIQELLSKIKEKYNSKQNTKEKEKYPYIDNEEPNMYMVNISLRGNEVVPIDNLHDSLASYVEKTEKKLFKKN